MREGTSNEGTQTEEEADERILVVVEEPAIDPAVHAVNKQTQKVRDLNMDQVKRLMTMGLVPPADAVDSIHGDVLLELLIGPAGSLERAEYELACEQAVQDRLIGPAYAERDRLVAEAKAQKIVANGAQGIPQGLVLPNQG